MHKIKILKGSFYRALLPEKIIVWEKLVQFYNGNEYAVKSVRAPLEHALTESSRRIRSFILKDGASFGRERQY